LLESPSDELELLLAELPGPDPGGADNLTSFGVFGVDGRGAASEGCEGCWGGCWDGGYHAMSGGEGDLSAGLNSTQ